MRRVLVWAAWGLVLVAGLGALLVWSSYRSYYAAIREFELRVGPADPGEYHRNQVALDRNAAVALVRAMAAVEPEAGWSRQSEPAAWTAADAEEARAVLARLERPLAALEGALTLPDCVWPRVPEEESAWASPALTGARALRLLGFVGVLEADRDSIVRSFRGLGRLAECLYGQPQLSGSLVATAVGRARLEVVRAAVASPATGPDLLGTLAEGLERSLEADRVGRVVAAEGALALDFVANPGPAGATRRRGPVHSVFARRVATELAKRWLAVRAWSEAPLDALLSAPDPEPEVRAASATVTADIMVPGLRAAVIEMRALEALTRLGLVAIESRRQGLVHGSYDDALAEHPELGTIADGDGGMVILDAGLERLLQGHATGSGAEPSAVTTAALELTVWRLPPPPRSQG